MRLNQLQSNICKFTEALPLKKLFKDIVEISWIYFYFHFSRRRDSQVSSYHTKTSIYWSCYLQFPNADLLTFKLGYRANTALSTNYLSASPHPRAKGNCCASPRAGIEPKSINPNPVMSKLIKFLC